MDGGNHATGETPRVIPDGWIPLGPALAWVAFGTAIDEVWNECVYFGASRWFERSPKGVAAELRCFIDGDDEPFTSPVPAPELAVALESEVFSTRPRVFGAGSLFDRAEALTAKAKDGSLPLDERLGRLAEAQRLFDRLKEIESATRAPSIAELKEAASRILASLELSIPEAEDANAALWRASEAVRRAVARGDLPAYGWPGTLAKEEARNVAPARARIPPEVCQAPVTVTQGGILAFARHHDFPNEFVVLWHGILMDAEDLLKLWPVAGDARPSTLYEPPPPPAMEERRRGGRPPVHDWTPFRREVVTRLALDRGDFTRTEFRKAMKEWAAENMDSAPDDRTIERQIDDLVSPTLYAPE